MKTLDRMFRGSVLLAIFLLPASRAQAPAHAPDGGSSEHLQSVMIPPKPGAPFTATVVTDWTRLMQDGSTTTVKNHRTIARDSNGRVFQERRYLAANGDTQLTPLSALEYSDPNRHEFCVCSPANRVCTVYPRDWPAPTPASLPATINLQNGAGTITREALGERFIDNLQAVGSREVTTINPTAANGYKTAEPTIKEFWYSPDLEVNLVTRRFEPRGGSENFVLKHINLNEPNPSLFTPPADYKIVHADR